MKRKAVLFVAALVVVGGCQSAAAAPAEEQPDIDKAIKQCLDVVHRFPADQFEAPFFKQFDAYFNRVTGQVENNAYRGGDAPVLYQFNKCMASYGYFFKPKT